MTNKNIIDDLPQHKAFIEDGYKVNKYSHSVKYWKRFGEDETDYISIVFSFIDGLPHNTTIAGKQYDKLVTHFWNDRGFPVTVKVQMRAWLKEYAELAAAIEKATLAYTEKTGDKK